MGAMASLITSLTSVYSTVHPGADQRKHQSSASLAPVRGIHRRLVNSPHKWPLTRKFFFIWWRHHAVNYPQQTLGYGVSFVNSKHDLCFVFATAMLYVIHSHNWLSYMETDCILIHENVIWKMGLQYQHMCPNIRWDGTGNRSQIPTSPEVWSLQNWLILELVKCYCLLKYWNQPWWHL